MIFRQIMRIPPTAIDIASKSDHPDYRHAAIVVRGGAQISIGYNHGWRHAEVVALGPLWPSKRVGSRVWSLRFTKTGRLAMAKPCPSCEEFMRRAGVRVVYFSNRDGEIEVMKLRRAA